MLKVTSNMSNTISFQPENGYVLQVCFLMECFNLYILIPQTLKNLNHLDSSEIGQIIQFFVLFGV